MKQSRIQIAESNPRSPSWRLRPTRERHSASPHSPKTTSSRWKPGFREIQSLLRPNSANCEKM